MLIDLIGYLVPKNVYCLTVLIDSTTKLAKNYGSALMSFDDMDVLAQLSKASSPRLSTVTANLSSMYLQPSLAAILNPAMMLVGWTFILISSLALLSNSAARMTTLVVPSPTSESCNCANWTRRLPTGCST
jgi:hypothetical protein